MRKEKRHDDVEHTHMNHITITRPNRNIHLATDRNIDQEYINEIAAHVRQVESGITKQRQQQQLSNRVDYRLH